jgi:hypothetical protein
MQPEVSRHEGRPIGEDRERPWVAAAAETRQRKAPYSSSHLQSKDQAQHQHNRNDAPGTMYAELRTRHHWSPHDSAALPRKPKGHGLDPFIVHWGDGLRSIKKATPTHRYRRRTLQKASLRLVACISRQGKLQKDPHAPATPYLCPTFVSGFICSTRMSGLIMVGSEGPYTSASKMPTLAPI